MSTGSVALLGAGKMGSALVDRWREAGREVVVWNRTPAAAEAVAGGSVRASASLAEAVSGAEVVVTMLTHGQALTSVLIDGGAIAAMAPGSTLVDLSTVDVRSSRAVAESAEAHGIPLVRGAVSGSPLVVRAGDAGLLLSGPAEAIAAVTPVLDEVAARLTVVGEGEEARVLKIAVNSMLAGTMQLLAEATAVVEASGVPREVFLDSLSGTVMSSRFLGYKSDALRNRQYAATFTTTDMQKDMRLARDLAEDAGVAMHVGHAVLRRLDDAIEAGYGGDDFASVFRLEQAESGLPVDPRTPEG